MATILSATAAGVSAAAALGPACSALATAPQRPCTKQRPLADSLLPTGLAGALSYTFLLLPY